MAKFGNAICMFLAGASLGWLVGLSASPVIQGIITAVTGIVVALAALYSGSTEMPAGAKPSLLFVAMLLIGIAVGSSFGLYGRTHNWLGVDPLVIKAQLENAGVGKEEAIKQAAALIASPDAAKQIAGQLYSGSAPSDCLALKGKEGAELVALMKASASPGLSRLATRCSEHPECLKAFVEEILCGP